MIYTLFTGQALRRIVMGYTLCPEMLLLVLYSFQPWFVASCSGVFVIELTTVVGIHLTGTNLSRTVLHGCLLPNLTDSQSGQSYNCPLLPSYTPFGRVARIGHVSAETRRSRLLLCGVQLASTYLLLGGVVVNTDCCFKPRFDYMITYYV